MLIILSLLKLIAVKYKIQALISVGKFDFAIIE